VLETATIRDILLLDKMVPDVWVIRVDQLPWTVNEQRRWHHMTRAKKVKEWRELACWLSREAKIPKMKAAHVHSVSLLKRMTRDCGAEFYATKAVIDGAITDAGVMPDDTPEYVRSITFHAPIRYSRNQMAMLVERCE
jgi:hypothetical protein